MFLCCFICTNKGTKSIPSTLERPDFFQRGLNHSVPRFYTWFQGLGTWQGGGTSGLTGYSKNSTSNVSKTERLPPLPRSQHLTSLLKTLSYTGGLQGAQTNTGLVSRLASVDSFGGAPGPGSTTVCQEPIVDLNLCGGSFCNIVNKNPIYLGISNLSRTKTIPSSHNLGTKVHRTDK